MTTLRFDQALECGLTELQQVLGSLPQGIHVVRDMSGCLTFVWPHLRPVPTSDVQQRLHRILGRWSAGISQVLIAEDDLLDASDVVASPDRRVVSVQLEGDTSVEISLIDRLASNQEWLRQPLPAIPGISLASAFSIKGGVGRSTAFAVWAWYLARIGKRVAVIDLDLEAPGIASILLDKFPDFGLTDWLIEALPGYPVDSFADECIAPWFMNSEFTEGSVHVVPAFGEKSKNYIEKLGRLYVPGIDSDGTVVGLTERLHRFIGQLAASRRYDVVLVDSRAGLHDIAASVVCRLQSEVFMFARDEPQGWAAYLHLFRHLRESSSVRWNSSNDDSDLRWRLKMVGAQSETQESARQTLVERSYAVWLELYDVVEGDESNLFTFTADDTAAPHFPLMIPFDPRVRAVNLCSRQQLPAWDIVWSTFGPFLSAATERLDLLPTGPSP